ncbi:MAG: NAD synthetase [Candidatus Competibacter sp.]
MTYELYPWLWKCRPFTVTDLAIGKWVGFCYIIHNHDNDKRYIGMKNFYFKRGKKKAPSDWPTYYGSNKALQEDVKRLGPECFTRTIVSLHTQKLSMRYSEKELIFQLRAIESPDYYNLSIDGRYQRLNRTQSIYDEVTRDD